MTQKFKGRRGRKNHQRAFRRHRATLRRADFIRLQERFAGVEFRLKGQRLMSFFARQHSLGQNKLKFQKCAIIYFKFAMILFIKLF